MNRLQGIDHRRCLWRHLAMCCPSAFSFLVYGRASFSSAAQFRRSVLAPLRSAHAWHRFTRWRHWYHTARRTRRTTAQPPTTRSCCRRRRRRRRHSVLPHQTKPAAGAAAVNYSFYPPPSFTEALSSRCPAAASMHAATDCSLRRQRPRRRLSRRQRATDSAWQQLTVTASA